MSVATQGAESRPEEKRTEGFDVRALGLDALVVAAFFVVAGVLGALLWWRVVDLPRATRTGNDIILDPVQLTRQVAIEGWFFVIAMVGGLLGGAGLTWWRRRDPIATVVLVVLGAGLAAYLMVELGQWLGPDSPSRTLAGKPQGATAPVRLAIQASGVPWVWPLTAALGALAVLWSQPNPPDGAA